MWWVPAGHRPTIQEAIERLEHLKAHGASDHAFGWESLPSAQLWQDREVRMSTITHNGFWRTLTLLARSISRRASSDRGGAADLDGMALT